MNHIKKVPKKGGSHKKSGVFAIYLLHLLSPTSGAPACYVVGSDGETTQSADVLTLDQADAYRDGEQESQQLYERDP